jgi:hypothetical protein
LLQAYASGTSTPAIINLRWKDSPCNRIVRAGVVCCIGLDPRPDDSGNHRGKRHITQRGDSELRRLLPNAAMAAARTALWRPDYARSLKRGLANTEARFELARRPLRGAWALDRHPQNFDPEKVRIA